MIREIRRKRRLTQAQLGKLSGVPRLNIVRVENGQRELKASEAIRIAHTLGVTVEELISGQPERTARLKKTQPEHPEQLVFAGIETPEGGNSAVS